ncbi:MAG: 5-oxoprolinase subunit PxpB [Thermodesulfobacteriota bacterium]
MLAGDLGLLVEYGDKIDPAINKRIWEITIALEKFPIEGIVETVPTYRSILIFYDPLRISIVLLQNEILAIETKLKDVVIPAPETIELPVVYGGEYGPDLEFVARHNGLTPEEVIDIHTSGNYLIYMLGFTPGFPFLGGLSERIFTPRLKTPRSLVPAGSVGIANNQTGIYPIESPGGWQLIGRTPIKLFNPSRRNPILLQAGNILKFKKITEEQYQEILKSG